jgi:hypothetical protein
VTTYHFIDPVYKFLNDNFMSKFIRSLVIFYSLTTLAQVPTDFRVNSDRAAQIVHELSEKCREYRKKYSYKETRKRLTQDAKKYNNLIFNWPENEWPSMSYKGITMGLMASGCPAPDDPPAM